MRGEISTTTVLVDSIAVVGQDDPPDPNTTRIDQFVDRIRQALDDHLTDLGRGGTGTLGAIRAEQVPGSDPELTAELASDERWVIEAAYVFTVGHRGHPVWAEVTASLERSDGSTATPTLVFVAADDRTPRLAAWEATIEPSDLPRPSPTSPGPAATASPARGPR